MCDKMRRLRVPVTGTRSHKRICLREADQNHQALQGSEIVAASRSSSDTSDGQGCDCEASVIVREPALPATIARMWREPCDRGSHRRPLVLRPPAGRAAPRPWHRAGRWGRRRRVRRCDRRRQVGDAVDTGHLAAPRFLRRHDPDQVRRSGRHQPLLSPLSWTPVVESATVAPEAARGLPGFGRGPRRARLPVMRRH